MTAGSGPELLIDIEILAWRVCWRARDLAGAMDRLEARLAALAAAHRARAMLLALSTPPLFRRTLWPGYKARRKPRPPLVKALLERVAARPEAVRLPGLEADDVLGVLATGGAAEGRRASPGAVIVSADKDLRSVPGWHGDAEGRRWRIGAAEADRAHLFQTLTGDAADGYPGCPGVGPVRARRLLDAAPAGLGWRAVRAAYRAAGQSEADALRQARLARILRAVDFDAERGVPRLWSPGLGAACAPGLR